MEAMEQPVPEGLGIRVGVDGIVDGQSSYGADPHHRSLSFLGGGSGGMGPGTGMGDQECPLLSFIVR